MSDYNGTPGDDTLSQVTLGLPAYTVVLGGAGNDIITLQDGTAVGQQGNDTITGTSSGSAAAYWDSPAGVVVNLVTGQVQDGWGTVDHLSGIRTINLSGNNDTVVGSSNDETFWENGGSNTINGGDGNDTVIYYDATASQAIVTYDAATRTFNVVKNFTDRASATDLLQNVESVSFKLPNGFTETIHYEDITGPFKLARVIPMPSSTSTQQLLEGDFNGDGLGDVWVSHIDNNGYGDNAVAPQVLLGDGAGGFVDGTASVFAAGVPVFHFAARVGGADFNGDGITDVFVPDFGPDHAPFPGGQNRLFVSASGLLTDQTAKLEQRLTYGHGLSIGDLDGNGFPDVLVNALNDQGGGADQVIFSNGTGGFTTASTLFPASIQKPGSYAAGHTWSFIGDLNDDGFNDVVLGTNDAPTPSPVLLASGAAAFPASGLHYLPRSAVTQEIVLAITEIDLNGDHLNDLVVAITNGDGGPSGGGAGGGDWYKENYVQFLVNLGGGEFRDETQARYAQDPSDHPGYWYKFIEVVDFNGDGADDMLVLSDTPSHSAELLLNDGAGHFQLARTFSGLGSVHAMDVNGDAIPEIVGVNQDSLSVYENTIFAGNATGLVFHPGTRDEHITGGAGTDTVVYAGALLEYDLSATGSGWEVAASSYDIDTLAGIERLEFSDVKLAVDLAGHAGTVAKLLGAVFGAAAVHNESYVGIGLSMLDAGVSDLDLMNLALNVRLGGGATNAAVVSLLYTNVIGVPPSQSELAAFTQLLDSGSFTQASLGMMAAGTVFNLENVDLVGLAKTGLAFV